MMTKIDGCGDWVELSDREALGEQLSPREAARLREHEGSCQACADEAAMFRSLSVRPLEIVPTDDQVESIIRAAASHRVNQPPAASRPRWSRMRVGGAALTCLAAAAAVTLIVRARRDTTNSRIAEAPAAVSVPAQVSEVSSARLPASASELDANRWVASSGTSCRVVLDNVTVCLEGGAEARIDKLTGANPVIELVRGRAVASLPPRPLGTSFAIATTAATVRVVGTIFSVELERDGTTVARVLRGEVAVQPAGAIDAPEPQHLRAGQALRVGAPSGVVALGAEERKRDLALLPDEAKPGEGEANASHSASARPSNEDPLARARLLRARGQFSQAAALYESIHATNPQSASGRAALLGLAELRLSDLGDAAGAVKAFDAYLAGGEGGLTREAAYGRIRALRALGRTAQERGAIERFIATYPTGPDAQTLRLRLDAIRGL